MQKARFTIEPGNVYYSPGLNQSANNHLAWLFPLFLLPAFFFLYAFFCKGFIVRKNFIGNFILLCTNILIFFGNHRRLFSCSLPPLFGRVFWAIVQISLQYYSPFAFIGFTQNRLVDFYFAQSI
jgi:hypothetical protein